MVLNLDIAPTLLDVADAKPLDGMDGESWTRLFREDTRDGIIWMNRPYAESLGLHYEPIGNFNEKCNVPLGSKPATAVFRSIAPPSPRSFDIETQAPAGQVRFLPDKRKPAE
jgi:hypothetical protein